MIVDYETSTSMNAERLKHGKRVAVFAIDCPEFFRSSEALDVVSPKCFGCDQDYVPLKAID